MVDFNHYRHPHHPTPASIDPLLSKPHQQQQPTTAPIPSRNMLSERVESLPSLLRLEGRLGLLGKLGWDELMDG